MSESKLTPSRLRYLQLELAAYEHSCPETGKNLLNINNQVETHSVFPATIIAKADAIYCHGRRMTISGKLHPACSDLCPVYTRKIR